MIVTSWLATLCPWRGLNVLFSVGWSDEAIVFVPRAPERKYHKLNSFKNKQIYVSWFWRYRGHNQDVDRATLPLKPVEENPFLPVSGVWWLPILGAPYLLAIALHALRLPSHGHLPVCLCLRVASLLLPRKQAHEIRGPPYPSVTLS